MEEINPKHSSDPGGSVEESNQIETSNLISDDQLLGVYGEMLDLVRQDRAEVSSILNEFLEMVVNGGESSSASKEAIVQLMKTKLDCVSTMGKVADLMTRVKLKEKDTFPPYLKGNTTIQVGDSSKKDLIKQLNKMAKQKEKGGT